MDDVEVEREGESPLSVGTAVVLVHAGATIATGYVLAHRRVMEGWRYDIGPRGGPPQRWSVLGTIVFPVDLTDRESIERWLDA